MEKILPINHGGWDISAVFTNHPQIKQLSSFSISKKSNVRVNILNTDLITNGSMRKKTTNKRSNHHKPQPPSMPIIVSSNSHLRTTQIVVFVSVISAVAVIALSLNSWSSVRSNDGVSDLIHSFEIVQEFPHDPNAFTQVNFYIIFQINLIFLTKRNVLSYFEK